MPLAAGQLLNNRYQIEKRIGQGGFGAVYRAYDTRLQQLCAFKENLNTSPEAQRQFEREALILARLRHPNLPRVTDHFFIPEQGQYLVMDFIEGQSLHVMLALREGPLPQPEALAWVSQVCQALDYLHRQIPPIIHRDIKPQNVIITPAGRAILVDFGISKLHDPQLRTTTGAQGGTFGYSPPEQYGQGRTDARSDVYALGATLYVLLTRHRPPDAIERLVHAEPLIPPGELNPDISPHVEQAILKAMDTTTGNRFQSVEAFRLALAKSAPFTEPVKIQPGQSPPPMLPPSRGSLRLWQWRTFIGASLMILLVAAVGIPLLIIPGGQIDNQLRAAASSGLAMTQTATVTSASSTATLPPTLSPTPTWRPPTPTQTSVPPTDTPLPIVAEPPPSPTPTETAIPPTATPAPAYQYELIEWSGEKSSVTRFFGSITDLDGNPVDGVFIQASCYNFSTISYPSGPVGWGPLDVGSQWEPGFYDITVDAKPVPCPWTLQVVETEDRQTVKTQLSEIILIEVTQDNSAITANWRKNW